MSLLSYNAPAVSWKTVGQKVTGKIVDVEEQQELQFRTLKPLYWGSVKGEGKVTHEKDATGKDLNPAMQLVITVQTDALDPGVPNDNGERRLFLKNQALAALKMAVRPHRITDYDDLIDAGIEVAYVSNRPTDGGYDQKIFAVSVTPGPKKANKPANLLAGPASAATPLGNGDVDASPATFQDILGAVTAPAAKQEEVAPY